MTKKKTRPRGYATTLQHWLTTQGTADLARLLNVDRSTVRYWKRGYILPTSYILLKIKQKYFAKLDMNRTVETHFATTNKRKRKPTPFAERVSQARFPNKKSSR